MSKKKILIVEDESIHAFLLKTILEEKYEIVNVVARGCEAVDNALEQKPDLIIMDIMLADDITGIEAIYRIQKIRKVKHVYCTAFTDQGIVAEAEKTNPEKIIYKPYDLDEFLNSVNNILQ